MGSPYGVTVGDVIDGIQAYLSDVTVGEQSRLIVGIKGSFLPSRSEVGLLVNSNKLTDACRVLQRDFAERGIVELKFSSSDWVKTCDLVMEKVPSDPSIRLEPDENITIKRYGGSLGRDRILFPEEWSVRDLVDYALSKPAWGTIELRSRSGIPVKQIEYSFGVSAELSVSEKLLSSKINKLEFSGAEESFNWVVFLETRK